MEILIVVFIVFLIIGWGLYVIDKKETVVYYHGPVPNFSEKTITKLIEQMEKKDI